MLYDIIMTTLVVASVAVGVWASRKMSKAAKEGKLRVIGTDDSDRLDWLAADRSRLQDVYWRLETEDGTLREAIDFFARNNEPKRDSRLDS